MGVAVVVALLFLTDNSRRVRVQVSNSSSTMTRFATNDNNLLNSNRSLFRNLRRRRQKQTLSKNWQQCLKSRESTLLVNACILWCLKLSLTRPRRSQECSWRWRMLKSLSFSTPEALQKKIQEALDVLSKSEEA